MSETDSKSLGASVFDAAIVREMAITLAHRENLVANDGQIYCWHCNRLGALLPSLACRECLEAQIERTRAQRERERTMHPETARWAALERNMREESRLDREAAADLLRRAHELDSATPERREMLTRAFEARFGRERQEPQAWAGRQFRRRAANGGGDDR